MSAPDKPRIDELQQRIDALHQRMDKAEGQSDIERMIAEQRRKEEECEASGGHERVATKDTGFGWHEGHCAKCGKNLNYDSSG